MIEAALIPLCAIADRVRGGWRPLGQWMEYPAKFGYGVMLAALLGLPWQWWPAVSVLWWLGEKAGWGYPMGQIALGIEAHRLAHPDAKPEWWQVGPLKNLPWPSLVVRGLMWSVPACVVVTPWHPEVLTLTAMMFAMPAGEFLNLHTRRLGYAWLTGETYRGFLMGLAAWMF